MQDFKTGDRVIIDPCFPTPYTWAGEGEVVAVYDDGTYDVLRADGLTAYALIPAEIAPAEGGNRVTAFSETEHYVRENA